jgi:urease accessory protein
MALVSNISVMPLPRQVCAPADGSIREGVARLELAADHSGKTALQDLFHSQPLHLLFPFESDTDVFQAVIACVSGGIVGGDRLNSTIWLGEGAKALVIGQAAEKVYRSLGADSFVENNLEVRPSAWLEWLPQETIIFDGARLRRRTVAHVHAGGELLGGDILVFGREARGENLASGLVQDCWEIRDENGVLIWKDVLHMDGDLAALLGHPATFDRARAYGTIIYRGAAGRALLALLRAELEKFAHAMLRIGVTLVRDVLLIRILGRSVIDLRRAFARIWSFLRHQAAGLPCAMPRLWAI